MKYVYFLYLKISHLEYYESQTGYYIPFWRMIPTYSKWIVIVEQSLETLTVNQTLNISKNSINILMHNTDASAPHQINI